jgi:glutamyl endopeptidase
MTMLSILFLISLNAFGGIFGEDDRVAVNERTTYPYSAVGGVHLQNNTTATGFLIGKKVVLTVAHAATQAVGFSPGFQSGEVPYGSFKIREIVYSQGWTPACLNGHNIKENCINFDFAFLILEENVGALTGFFSLIEWTDAWFLRMMWSQVGYGQPMKDI